MYYKMFVETLIVTTIPCLLLLGIVCMRITWDKVFKSVEDALYNEGSLPLIREIMRDDDIVRILLDKDLNDWEIMLELQALGREIFNGPRHMFKGRVKDEDVGCFFEKGVIKVKVLRPETRDSLSAAVDYFIANRPCHKLGFEPVIVYME